MDPRMQKAITLDKKDGFLLLLLTLFPPYKILYSISSTSSYFFVRSSGEIVALDFILPVL